MYECTKSTKYVQMYDVSMSQPLPAAPSQFLVQQIPVVLLLHDGVGADTRCPGDVGRHHDGVPAWIKLPSYILLINHPARESFILPGRAKHPTHKDLSPFHGKRSIMRTCQTSRHGTTPSRSHNSSVHTCSWQQCLPSQSPRTSLGSPWGCHPDEP